MEQLLKKLAGCWHQPAAGGDVARQELYQAITAKGLAGDEEESTSRAFERQRGAILRVLVRDCQSSCDDIQKSALELLGHVVAMASSCEGPACQPSQASSLWMAVARVLDGEDSKRMVKVMALFAIAKNTMAPDLVAPSVAQLAPAVARTMRMESTVARQQSAMAIHSLLGSVPGAMALCDPGRADRPEEEDSFWVRCLLRLCFDDAVKVRADALKAAERAVSLGGLRGNAGVAAWVLEALRNGRLSQGMNRVLFYDASSQSQAAATAAVGGGADPLPHASGSSSTAAALDRTNPRQATPQRVKHAIRVWAVYLSLADPTSLLRAKDSAGKKRLLDVGTGLFTWLSGKSADGRDDVKVQAVEAWEMFAVSMMAQISREEAKKVAHMFLRALSRWVLKEKGVVREVAMSSLMRVVASFPSTSLKPLWATTWKGDKKSKGLGEVLRDVAGGSSGEIAQHHSARILAALLPCFRRRPAEPHPLLRDAGLNLGEEQPLVLSILETLMEAFPSPIPEDAACAVDAAAPLLPPCSSSRGVEEESCCADVRLEVLPTTGLIANAWCGLVFWAMEQAAAAAAAAAAGLDVEGTGKGKAGAADAVESASDNKDDSGKGHGNTAAPAAASDCRKDGSGPSSSSAGPPKENEASEASRPLQVLLEWLLGVRARPSTGVGAKVTAVTEKAVPGSSTAEGRGKAAAISAVSPTTDHLASWKDALLAALIRGLSRRLDVHNTGTEAGADDPDTKLPERAWLDTPVDSSSVFDGAAGNGDCPASAEFLLAGGVIRQSISRKWLKSETPLWLVLLTGVLRGRCGLEYRCLDGSGGGGTGGRSRVVREACHKGNPRHESGVTNDGARGGGESTCQSSPVFLPQSFLTGALSLSPSGWSAQLLASLLTGVRSAKGRTQEEEDSALVVIGHVWRAEAARNLAEWNRCLPLSPNSYVGAAGAGFDVGTQGVTPGGDRYRGGPAVPQARTVGSTAAGVDVQQQQQRQPSENLRTATANTLRFLLQAACSLFSRQLEGNTRGLSQEPESAAGQACGAGSRAAGSTGIQNAAAAVAEHDGNLRGGDSSGWSQDGKRSSAVESVFGSEAARLWLGLFEARRSSTAQPKGLSKLVKALAKDCGNCAFVVSGAPLGGGKGGEGEGGSSAAPPPAVWGLDFSQTQPPSRQQQQQQQQQPRAGQGESGDFASTTQGDKTAGAAAARYDMRSNTDDPESNKQNGCGDALASPPPFVALPVLTAAALALLTAAPAEADAKARGRAWKAGSATLAWTLTATAAAPGTTTWPPPASLSRTQRSSVAAAAAAAGVAAGEEERTAVPAGVCQCIVAVRSCLTAAAAADSVRGGLTRSSSGTTGFPLDRDSLAPVCRLLAVAVRSSYATGSAAAVAATSAAADASPESSPGSRVRAAPSSSTAAAGTEVVAADPAVRLEIRGLVACALSASRKVAASPGLLTTLSPLLEAVLDVPSSSCDADSLQSSLLDVWNATFGKLNLKQPPAPAWKAAFSPPLLRRLSDLSRRAEVEMPPGITLPVLDTAAAPTPTTAQGLRCSGLSENKKGVEEGGMVVEESARGGGEAREGAEYSQPESAGVGELRAAAAGGWGRGRPSPGCAWNGGVAGALPAEGGRRSFMKQASRSPSPSHSRPTATPKKRSTSPTSPDGGFSGKFVRVVGNGRGSGGNRGTPKRRAAVTTHTSLDGSQSIAPWEDGSQLPDTNPDSGPDLPLEEVLPPPPPRNGVTATTAPQAPSTSTSPATTETTSPGSAASPSKRCMEDTGSETVDPNKTSPPSGTAAPGAGVSPPGSSSASDRWVRPRIMTSASVNGASGGGDDADGFGHDPGDDMPMGGGAAACCSSGKVDTAAAAAAEKEVATMAAIAKAMPSGGGGGHRHVEVDSEMSEITSSAQAPLSGQQRGGGGVAVDALLQDVRSLARRVEAARSAMSPEQLEEVGALLQKAVES